MTMDPNVVNILAANLTGLGLGLLANGVTEYVKAWAEKPSSIPQLERELRERFPSLTLDNVQVVSQRAVNILAEHGIIEVRGTQVIARSVTLGSGTAGEFLLTDSTLRTSSHSKIDVKRGGAIQGRGRAQIDMDKDGNISFST